MGDIDVAICEYIAENERVADLFNGLYFQGERTIRAENIEDYEEKYPVKCPTGGKRSKRTGKVRYRDIVKKLKSGGSLRILAMENQNQVDYTMPFRCMEYDTMEYRRQIDHRIRENEKNPDFQLQVIQTGVLIENRSTFVNASEYNIHYEILDSSGKKCSENELCTDVPAGTSKFVDIPFQCPAEPGEYRYQVSLCLKKDVIWAPKGYVIATTETKISNLYERLEK